MLPIIRMLPKYRRLLQDGQDRGWQWDNPAAGWPQDAELGLGAPRFCLQPKKLQPAELGLGTPRFYFQPAAH